MAILSFQPVLERIQYLHFKIFWKKEGKLNRNIGSSKLNSPEPLSEIEADGLGPITFDGTQS